MQDERLVPTLPGVVERHIMCQRMVSLYFINALSQRNQPDCFNRARVEERMGAERDSICRGLVCLQSYFIQQTAAS